MTRQRRRRKVKDEWIRRGVQTASLTTFAVLMVMWPRMPIDWLPAQLFSRVDPLIGLTVVIASRGLFAYAALGLVTVALTLTTGRTWCGWACPVGTLLDVLPSAKARLPKTKAAWWRLGKYATLGLVLGAAAFGTLSPMILDPVTIAQRPLQELAMRAVGSDALGRAVGAYLSRDLIGAVAYLSVAPLLLVVALNALGRRTWCRSLCPLGGMLAAISLVALVRRRVDTEACTRCGKCARACPTDAISPKSDFSSSSAECVVCMRCKDECPSSAIRFGMPHFEDARHASSPTRRAALATLGATGASIAGALILPDVVAAEGIIRPPATTEKRLAERCVRCGACYSACPTGALRPSTSLVSESGLWTPMLDERPALCTLECNLCGGVCPTDAIHVPDEWEALALGLGKFARVDRSLCVAWRKGDNCLRCRAVCPIRGAIVTDDETVTYRWETNRTKVPVVVPDLCVACGLCTEACPTAMPAIRVR